MNCHDEKRIFSSVVHTRRLATGLKLDINNDYYNIPNEENPDSAAKDETAM